MHRPVCFALAAALLRIPVNVEAQTTGPSSGSLVIVGGAMRDPGILQRFLDLAGGGDASIVVIPTAGGGDDYDEFYSGLRAWRNQGATNLTVLHTNDRSEADSDEFIQAIREPTASGSPADVSGAWPILTSTPRPNRSFGISWIVVGSLATPRRGPPCWGRIWPAEIHAPTRS